MSNLRTLYRPRPQFWGFHTRKTRWFMMVAHRRAGKTVSAVNDLIEKATYNTRESPRYGYIAPFLKQAKQIAWEYLKKFAAPYAPKISEAELYVELTALPNRPRITIYGADNPDSFRGLYFDGVVLDEFGNIDLSIWKQILLPALVDRKGWAVFMGTPNGPNHFRDMWYEAEDKDGWSRLFLPVSVTKIIDDEELAMMKANMDEEEYAQEMECSFEASVRGAIYARQMELAEKEGRIGDWKAQKGLPVHVVADLGWSDLAVFGFFQERPDGVVIDRVYANNMQPIDHYIKDIKQYFHVSGHMMGKIWLPHDAKAKSLQTGKSIVEQFIKHKLRPNLVARLEVRDGIDAVRQIFPFLYMNKKETKTHVLALKSYKRQYDEKLKTYTDAPVHDWSSHYADMQRYMALVAKKRAMPVVKPTARELNYGFSLDDIWDTAPTRQRSRL